MLKLFSRKKPQKKPTFLHKQLTFVVLFLTSFLLVQGITWLGAISLPVIAQTPTEVTPPETDSNPNALVEEAKNYYRQQQFPEALNLLKQAIDTFQSQRNSLGSAIALDLQRQVYLAQGQPGNAADSFAAAATAYEQDDKTTEAVKSRLHQAEALRKAGFYRRSEDVLKQLEDNLTEQPPEIQAIARRSEAITQRLIGNLAAAQAAINQSLEIAETLPSPEREEHLSAAYLMLGNIAKDQSNIAKERNESNEATTQFQDTAIASYQKAAETATTPTERVQAQLNRLSTVNDSGKPFGNTEQELLRQVRATIDELPLSQTAVQARINWARMVMEQENRADFSAEDIVQQLAKAIEQARTLKDQRSESYALGQLGELRLQLGQQEQLEQAQRNTELEQAQRNTEQALEIAQAIGASDIAYRWQRQLGQILKGQKGKENLAIGSYRAAVSNLKSTRGDLLNVNPDAQFSFRESVEPVYREYAGLLLKSGSDENLREARTAIESLQQAELVNYFREDCITSTSRAADEILAEVDRKAALIYSMVIETQLEVIVTLPNPDQSQSTKPLLRHYSTTLNQDQVEKILADLRQRTQNARAAGFEVDVTTEGTANAQRQDYLPLAQQVYGWLIKPFEEDLEKSGVDTLVFVLDTPLQNLPMSVLHDGERFLVEKYAIAQTPGLQILDPKPLVRGELTALKAGLSQGRDNFPPLKNVELELEEIQSEVPGEIILNEEFTTKAIERAIASAPFPVVHLATHGQFSSKAEETFILTFDNRLNINQLNQILRGREEGDTKALELLVLSACQTAVGDKRAALGLAGVAVKSGARSTIATLWQVDDESTANLMIQFYQELKDTTISKAKALQQAQLWLMREENGKYQSPYYWAPFILLGNWL